MGSRVGGCGLVAEHLPSMYKALSSIPSTLKEKKKEKEAGLVEGS